MQHTCVHTRTRVHTHKRAGVIFLFQIKAPAVV